MIISKINED